MTAGRFTQGGKGNKVRKENPLYNFVSSWFNFQVIKNSY